MNNHRVDGLSSGDGGEERRGKERRDKGHIDIHRPRILARPFTRRSFIRSFVIVVLLPINPERVTRVNDIVLNVGKNENSKAVFLKGQWIH